MKKIITLSAILALTVSTIAEAKGGRSGGRSLSSAPRTVATAPAKPSVMQSQGGAQRTQSDATFSNTAQPKAQAQSATQQRGNSTLANFATGAAAGYVLSEMLSPSEAQAQTPAAANQAQPMQQLAQQVENAAMVPSFKAFDAQNPALIGKAGDVNLYCLNGAMFLINAATNQPSALVDGQGAALQCKTAQ